jgi:hypothetical protein
MANLERSHGLSAVVWNKSLKKRNGSLNLLFGKESNDTDLCQSSVIKLLDKSLSLLCFSLLLGESEGIEKIKRNRVGDKLRSSEVGEVTGLSSTHVMGSCSLGKPLKESDEDDDLPLSSITKSIPLLRRGSSSVRVWGSISGDGEWPVESVGLNDVSCGERFREALKSTISKRILILQRLIQVDQ